MAAVTTSGDVTHHTDFDADDIEWVGPERARDAIVIAEPDDAWSTWYAELAVRIRDALGADVLDLQHVGSTSVPGLAAKPVIDIDLTVPDTRDEAAYVPALEAAGFWLRLREPGWHEHRLLCAEDPPANVHVFGPGSPEVVRHRMLREWLTAHPDDRRRYAAAKHAAAVAANGAGESMMSYNVRKEPVIRDILDRMFRAHGLLPAEASDPA